MLAKFQALHWVNVTDLDSGSGASYVIADHYIFAIFFAVALHEKPKPQKVVPSFPRTDEYESITFVLFFWAICDFRCDF